MKGLVSLTLGLATLVTASGCSEFPARGDVEPGRDADGRDLLDAGGRDILDAGGRDILVDQAASPDAAHDLGPPVRVGKLVTLPLLDESFYQHTNEPTIAAHGGHIVAVYRNAHLLSADGYLPDDPDNPDPRKNAIAVSHDGGESFALRPNPAVTGSSSDPVVRVDTAGNFWFAQLEQHAEGLRCSVALSDDHGESWASVVQGLDCWDKEWIAVGADGLYLAARGGLWKVSKTPPYNLVANYAYPGGTSDLVLAGYADDHGAHFVRWRIDNEIIVWNGVGAPQVDDGPIAGTAFEVGSHNLESSIAIGVTTAGARWVVVEAPTGRVQLGTEPPDLGATFQPLSKEGATAFFPAAAVDSAGYLHAIWYESDVGRGELIYRRSRSADLSDGFEEPIVIDPQAIPTGGWHPSTISPDLHDRLRDYIDLATDGQRAHLIWTRAAEAPSRVMTTYVEHRD